MFRKLALKEWDIEHETMELQRKINSFTSEEFKLYAAATQEIEDAMSNAQDQINQSQWAFSTARQHMHAAANGTGKDTSVRA
jgi:hypothetical protein